MPRELKNQPGGWVTVAWEEFVGQDASHGAAWSTGWEDGNQATFQVLINWNDALQFEIDVLGYAKFNKDTGKLQRTMPVRHPVKSFLRAERIVSVQPVRWDEKLQNFTSSFLSVPAGVPVSQYSYFLVTIGFVGVKYRLLTDADTSGEWKRFCITDHKPSITNLSREGQLWQWDDAALGANNGAQLTAPVGVGIYSDQLHVTWKRVPRFGLFADSGESDYFNNNILSCFNKVHNGATDLWGYVNGATVPAYNANANTSALRFVGIDAKPIASPFDPIVQGLTATATNTYYDVDLMFHIWQPPAGNATNQGHCLAPYPNNLWYLIKTGNGGNRIFQTTDLTNIFTLSLI